MIDIRVNINDEVSPAIKRIIETLDGEKRADANAVGGRAANTAAIDYHREFNARGGWKGKNYLSGPGRSQGDFGQNVSLGWNFRSANRDGATIANNADFFAFKVSGGTIIPKRVKYLTIPIVSEAAGRRARAYERITGKNLFTVPGKKALFEKDGDGIRPVYALVSRVTQAPWPNALPRIEKLADIFAEAFINSASDDL